ncbi:Far upstream element-binding protein 2 [Durusdinium trenchii]|uniref:Far upstream element-binding protein 2 n=1 Tax=Durusdinium trenchii TaxID=1381693 RepID=A0ABP0QLP0_9DINO
MQDMVEALKSSEPAPTASAKKNDPDKPKGHKVIDLPAHLIRVLIGKAGSTIREVISRTGADIKVNHLPHEPQGSISVVGDIAKTEAVIQEIFRARGCKWSPTGAPLAEQSEEDVKIPHDLVGLFIGKGGETIKDLRERCGGQVSITIQPASTPGGMQGVRVPWTIGMRVGVVVVALLMLQRWLLVQSDEQDGSVRTYM